MTTSRTAVLALLLPLGTVALVLPPRQLPSTAAMAPVPARAVAAPAALVLAAPAAEEPLVNKVKTAIDNGVRYLRELENERGNFEHTWVYATTRKGGVTALAVVALLNSGVPPDDPLIQRCLKYLRTLEPTQSYTVGLQTMAFCLAGQKQDRQLILRNLKWIAQTQGSGGWGYVPSDAQQSTPDHSINQYVLLGVHEARVSSFEMDREMRRKLQDMYNHYNGHTSGTWGYRGRPASLTMTTAGLCNLLITGQDLAQKRKLEADGRDPDCGKYDDSTTVRNALAAISDNFPNDISKAEPNFPHPFYCLYGIERAGRLTGQRFFGEKDWYRIGCEYLVSIQQENGSWSGKGARNLDHWPPIATSLSLLFLSKGRTPVLISKLAHSGTPKEGPEEWNRKRYDVRHVVEFASRELFENKPLAWQVFDARSIVGRDSDKLAEELLQTPIVYMNGHMLTEIKDKKQEEMLRTYLNNGGFIFAEACCNSKQFDADFRDVIKKVTGSELGLLPKNHPVWNASGKFDSTPDRGRWPLEGIQQGCKTVVIYSPKALAGYWENNDYTSEKGKKAFHLAANIIAYATGMELPKPRLTEVEIVRTTERRDLPADFLRVTQFVTDRKAQFLAPKAIPHLMAEIGKLNLEVHQLQKKMSLTEDGVLDAKFFYMHDRNGFVPPRAEALENLKFTLENRGTLFADAACGSKAFDKSFRALIKTMWPDRELEPIKVKENQEKNGLYSREVNGELIREVKYRREEKDGSPSKDFRSGPPPLEGIKINGRWVVIYSKYDIGCALEKAQSTDCLGHDYESAVKLGKAVILYVLRGSLGG